MSEVEEFDLDALFALRDKLRKTEAIKAKEGGEVTEVYDKYKSLSGYRMTIFTAKKGKITQVFRIEGRITKPAAELLAKNELERLKRKYKIS